MSDSTERLGELLLRLGALTQHQIDNILEHQKEHKEMMFGQIAIGLGYLTPAVLEKYL